MARLAFARPGSGTDGQTMLPFRKIVGKQRGWGEAGSAQILFVLADSVNKLK
jgi:hypothetical protein